MENTLVLVLFSVFMSIFGFAFLGLIIFWLGKRYFRTIVQRLFSLVLGRLFEDDYSENLMELWSATQRTSIINILEISQRAQFGKIIKRPLGSPRKFPHYDNLLFVPAQMARLPIEITENIPMKVTLGPKANKPLILEMPLIISGMAYGEALSEEARIALARGAKQVGTALNSGEGPFLAEERQEAGKYIWQVSRSPYGRNPQAIAQADMIEVQMGQGSRVGGQVIDPKSVQGKALKLMGISPDQPTVLSAGIPGIKNPWDWPRYVADLRKQAGGKPIGLKIMSGGRLETDLAVAIEAGFDVIALGGAQGGSAGSSPTLSDDFGLPSIVALIRAHRYLVEQGVRKEISLIASGGYATPGECLKALALGADAVYLGTAPLFALVHGQIGKVLPWEPLTQLVWYDSKYKDRLDIDKAAQSVANLLQSFTEEMQEGIRALGKKSLLELGPNDLVALDDWTAELTGVKKI
ncbi:FMN-binding glutamate synthase family protein [Desulfitobacterium metallireducens]|uniref:Ferredoxin-dependent glutamate synthase n=1 Tax=Desulfitobacterium metallireducens DSM 15288 TaxID=871968 RepID=W0EAP5_9FIRM|nr:FMN-binding glutamate synthase family protein [Desulfitobacterium metallireducens]AHF07940.1 ferredoxin-dependent glutamate synthase [Desulfitobacterium metallireducens DSM 15288]